MQNIALAVDIIAALLWVTLMAIMVVTKATRSMSWLVALLFRAGVLLIACGEGIEAIDIILSPKTEQGIDLLAVTAITGGFGLICVGVAVILFHRGKWWT